MDDLPNGSRDEYCYKICNAGQGYDLESEVVQPWVVNSKRVLSVRNNLLHSVVLNEHNSLLQTKIETWPLTTST